jgi:hypothetical protein
MAVGDAVSQYLPIQACGVALPHCGPGRIAAPVVPTSLKIMLMPGFDDKPIEPA